MHEKIETKYYENEIMLKIVRNQITLKPCNSMYIIQFRLPHFAFRKVNPLHTE